MSGTAKPIARLRSSASAPDATTNSRNRLQKSLPPRDLSLWHCSPGASVPPGKSPATPPRYRIPSNPPSKSSSHASPPMPPESRYIGLKTLPRRNIMISACPPNPKNDAPSTKSPTPKSETPPKASSVTSPTPRPTSSHAKPPSSSVSHPAPPHSGNTSTWPQKSSHN